MTRHIGLILALSFLTAPTALDAQVGGLLRKKAGEVLGKKPEPAKTAPAPEPTPAPSTSAPATPASTPAGAGNAAPKGAAAPKAAVSPLDTSVLPLKQSADMALRDRINARSNGDWDQLPYIPAQEKRPEADRGSPGGPDGRDERGPGAIGSPRLSKGRVHGGAAEMEAAGSQPKELRPRQVPEDGGQGPVDRGAGTCR